mgnify:CR=1 FL=1
MYNKKIIILDDEEDNLILISELLRLSGHSNIQCFQSPQTVIDIFDENKQSVIKAEDIDLVLMDVMMPGISGFKVCELIKEQHPQVPVVLITALNDTDSQIHGIEAGADDFITKPIISARLTARVKSLLQHKHREDRLTADYESLKEIQKSLPAYVLKAKDKIDDYIVCKQLAESESSHIYQVKDTNNNYQALKILSDSLARTPEAIALFRAEIDTLMTISHPNIITISSYGFHQGLPFYTMPLIQGENLQKIVLENHPISKQCIIKILKQVIDTVQFIHSEEIIHQDIKPENFLYANKTVTMIDFGLSIQNKSTKTVNGGTEHYMAPEVLNRLPASKKSDIYSLGILAYFLVNATVPSADELASNILIFQRDSLDESIKTFIQMALNKNPKKRPVLADFGKVLQEMED